MLQSFGPLICLWTTVLSMSAVGAAGLQVLGPPNRALPAGPRDAASAAALPEVRPAPTAVPTANVPAAPAEVRGALTPPRLAAPSEAAAAPDANAPAPRPRTAQRRVDPDDAARPRSIARRSPLPPETIAAPFTQRTPPPVAPSYIGVYGTGLDGTRTFRSTP